MARTRAQLHEEQLRGPGHRHYEVKKKCLLIKESPSKYMYCISKKIFGVNFHIILEMSLWALANKTLD